MVACNDLQTCVLIGSVTIVVFVDRVYEVPLDVLHRTGLLGSKLYGLMS